MVYQPQPTDPPYRPGRPVCAVADSFCDSQQPPRSRVIRAYFASLEEQTQVQGSGKKATTIRTALFRREAQAVPGRRIWIIVETSDLEGVQLEIVLRCARTDALLQQGAALRVVQDDAGTETIRATVGGWNGGGRFQHTEAYGHWAIAEISPGPALLKDRKAMAKTLELCTDHRALLYLDVRALTGMPVEYSNEDPARPGNTGDRSIFLNEPGRYLELLSCCRADITFSQLSRVFPGAPADKIQGVADEFNRSYLVNGAQQKLFEIFHVDSCLRRAHFFAQAKVESRNVSGQELIGAFEGESFNYRVSSLLKGDVFSFIHDPDKTHLITAALDYGKGPHKYVYPDKKRTREIPATQKADEEALANVFNMDENRPLKIRLGNVQRGDGWKFRGHGILQMTGRENYSNAQTWLDHEMPGNSANLLNCGDQFTNLQVVVTGAYYWMTRGPLYRKADLGVADEMVDTITKLINAGMQKKSERRSAFLQTRIIFCQTDCLNTK